MRRFLKRKDVTAEGQAEQPRDERTAIEKADALEKEQAGSQKQNREASKGLMTAGAIALIMVIGFLLLPSFFPKAGPSTENLAAASIRALGTEAGTRAGFEADTSASIEGINGRSFSGSTQMQGAFSRQGLDLRMPSSSSMGISEMRVIGPQIYVLADDGWYSFYGDGKGKNAITSDQLRKALPGFSVHRLIVELLTGLHGASFQGPTINGRSTWQIDVDVIHSSGLVKLLTESAVGDNQASSKDAEAAAQLAASVVSAKIYLDKKTYFPLRIKLSIGGTVSDIPAVSVLSSLLNSFNFSTEINFSNWGRARRLAVPEAKKNLFDLLTKAENKAKSAAPIPQPDDGN